MLQIHKYNIIHCTWHSQVSELVYSVLVKYCVKHSKNTTSFHRLLLGLQSNTFPCWVDFLKSEILILPFTEATKDIPMNFCTCATDPYEESAWASCSSPGCCCYSPSPWRDSATLSPKVKECLHNLTSA